MVVGLGSALGGMARYILGKWIYNIYPHAFPLPTLIINVLGCFLIGLLYGISAMGFVMIFKSSSVLNFAHGELLAARLHAVV